jgi:DNA-binding winged helix-turn-helix (wHTH) protein/tetratricopeptide (TPR) repeat protein
VLYRFGEFELDAAAYTLTRCGVRLPLQPKVFDLLRCLLERRGRVVTKAELRAAVWAGEHVNDGALPWTVYHARRALGQDRGASSPIETVAGRGYRLIAAVEVVAGTELRSAEEPAPARETTADAAPAAPPLPFVGRGDVMERLEGRLAQALRGEGGICLVMGEAGIGKSRCAEALREVASRRGVRTWLGRSVEGLGAPVFWPWIQVLREAVREQPALREPGEQLLARITALDDDPDGTQARRRAGDRFWVLDAVSRFLLEAAEGAGTCVLLEDLHWADAATLDLLAFLTPQLGRRSLLILGTLRNEAALDDRRRASRLLRGVERIELGHLTHDDVGCYIEEFTRRMPSAPLCRAVHRATAGNPLFLQETVRALIACHGRDGLARLDPSAIGPSRVARDVLRARLSALDDEVLSVLASASVLGESFEIAILARVLGLGADALLEMLERACADDLIRSDGPHRYRFAHELLRSILYEDMPARGRVSTHRRAAEVLSELGHAEPRYSQIAHHFHRSLAAGDCDRVAAAAARAAGAASRMQAFEDAVTYYGWALEAQALSPAPRTRERAELLLGCGSAERLAGRYEDSRRTLSAAIELGRQQGWGDLLLRAARVLRPTHAVGGVPDPLAREALEAVLRVAPDGDPHRVGALSLLACVPPYAHDMRRSAELSGEAEALARRLGDPGWLLEALRARLHSLSGPDHVDAVIAVANEMLSLNERGGWMNGDAHVACVGANLYRGDVAAADAALREVEREARAARLPEAIWLHDRIRNQRRLLDGDFEAARAGCRELASRAKRMGLSYGRLFLNAQRFAIELAVHGPEIARGWSLTPLLAAGDDVQPSYRAAVVALLAQLGEHGEAKRMLEGMLADCEDIPKDIGYVNALAHLSFAVAELSDRERAGTLYRLLAPYALHNTPNSMLLYEGSASHPLARLAALLGDDARAEEHFETALAHDERLGARPQLARVGYDWARFLAERRSAARARTEADRAARLAGDLGMGWLASSARELAERC